MALLTDRPVPDSLHNVRTLAQLFAWRVAQTPQAPAYLEYQESTQVWVPVSYRDMGQRVEQFVAALQHVKLARGDRISTLLPNGLHAVCADQAALAMACVSVPLHALDNPASIAYILSDSDTAVLFAQTQAQWLALVGTGVPLPALRQVVIVEEATQALEPFGDCTVLSLASWLAQAGAYQPLAAQDTPEPDDLASIVYTSGTTGKPKGVMLSHANVLENVKATLARVTPLADDVFLSFLPLSHTFERTAGYYLPIAAGSCVAHARSVALLSEDMKTVRPTILISVPRIYERVFSVLKGMLAGSALKSRLFLWAQTVGWRRFCRSQKLPVSGSVPAWLDALVWPVLHTLVAKPLLAQFGGRLRAAVSGGAALSKPIAQCFLGLGLPILQGYGMTETSPVVAANGLDDNDPTTIGRVLPGVEVRIGENQELQVRGPSVMQGYWKREADTAAAFVDGWLRTGDQAGIENGRIRILGRIKEIIVTSTGEKIAPADLELAITSDPLFEQAYTFGDNRPFIGSIVVLGRAGWERMCAELGLPHQAPESLQAPAARQVALQRIRELTHGFPHYAQPKGVVLSLEPWTPDNTLLTPTLKLKRNNLSARFAQDIEGLYRR